MGSWLGGNGCVPIFNLMEDAATAEISRSQVWQWIRSPKGVLADGRKVTREMVDALTVDELKKTPGIVGDAVYAAGKYVEGAALFEQLIMDDNYEEFLTLPAYRAIA
jgi:malate synthase